MNDTRVKGRCPMGCGETLFVGDGGHVTCSWETCPRPSAADEILADGETGHVVELRRDHFTIRHPLRERLNGDLWDCDLHGYLAALDGPPAVTGRYRAYKVDGRWHFDALASGRVGG